MVGEEWMWLEEVEAHVPAVVAARCSTAANQIGIA